jgi:hypothetical protein
MFAHLSCLLSLPPSLLSVHPFLPSHFSLNNSCQLSLPSLPLSVPFPFSLLPLPLPSLHMYRFMQKPNPPRLRLQSVAATLSASSPSPLPSPSPSVLSLTSASELALTTAAAVMATGNDTKTLPGGVGTARLLRSGGWMGGWVGDCRTRFQNFQSLFFVCLVS